MKARAVVGWHNRYKPPAGGLRMATHYLLYSIILSYAFFDIPLEAQVPKGVFLDDTIEIGQPFRYAVSINHPVSMDVLFPDTSQFFSPFQVRSIAIYPTITTGKYSLDSAVYTLLSFQTTTNQSLRVPLFLVTSPTDCTTIYTHFDTVRMKERVNTLRPDTLQLSTNTQLLTLRQQMNYPLLFMILLGIFIVAGLVLLIFGKTIHSWIERYQLYQQNIDFQSSFTQLIQSINPETAHERAGQAVILWKEYMEWLERKPFTSLTTREIIESARDERLTDALKEIDGVVYGGVYSDKTQQSLRILNEVANRSYHQRSMLITDKLREGKGTIEE